MRRRYPDASGAADDAYGFVKSIGKFRATKRTEGISTSDLILRLVKVRAPLVRARRLATRWAAASRVQAPVGAWVATRVRSLTYSLDLCCVLCQDYNEYVLRNLGRGYTRHEMNVSFVRVRRRLRPVRRPLFAGRATYLWSLSAEFGPMPLFTQEKRLRLRGKLQAVGQKVRRFMDDHSELSQFAERFANRFLRVVKVRSLRPALPRLRAVPAHRGRRSCFALRRLHRARCGRACERGEAVAQTAAATPNEETAGHHCIHNKHARIRTRCAVLRVSGVTRRHSPYAASASSTRANAASKCASSRPCAAY